MEYTGPRTPRAMAQWAKKFVDANPPVAAPREPEAVCFAIRSPFDLLRFPDRLDREPLLTAIQYAAGKMFERAHEAAGGIGSNVTIVLAHMIHDLRCDRDDIGYRCWLLERRRERDEWRIPERIRNGELNLTIPCHPLQASDSVEADAERRLEREGRIDEIRQRLEPETYSRLHALILSGESIRSIGRHRKLDQRKATNALLADLDALVHALASLDEHFALAVMKVAREAQARADAEAITLKLPIKSGSAAAIRRTRSKKHGLVLARAAEVAASLQ